MTRSRTVRTSTSPPTPNGDESAAGGFVVGAARVDQRFVNNGDTPICAIRIAPSTSRYFEVYVFDSPVAPRAT